MGILKEFSSNTSIAPIFIIGRSKSYLAKLLWTGISLFSLSMLVYQTMDIIQRYYQYPKSISVELKPKSATFPWITLCNTEYVNYRMYVAANPKNGEVEDSEIMRKVMSEGKKLTESMLVPYLSFTENSNDIDEQRAFETYLDKAFDLASVLYDPVALATSHMKERKRFGLELGQLVALCMFQNKPCEFEDFHTVFDPKYYNCFTYKPNNETTNIIEQSGLTLVLFSAAGLIDPYQLRIEELDKVVKYAQKGRFSKIIDQRSIKVYVHPPNTKPGSYRESIDIGPGRFTNIQIKESFISRITTPKEKCQEGKTTRWEGVDYDETFVDCQRQCVYDYVWKKCNCDLPEVIVGMDVPEDKTKCYLYLWNNFTDIIEKYETIPNSEIAERLKNLDEDMCALKAVKEASEIKCDCNLPCKEKKYAKSISTSPWPKKIPSEGLGTYGIMDDIFSTADFSSKFTKLEKDVMEELYGIPFNNITQAMKKMHRYPFDLQKEIMSHFTLVDIYFSNTDVEHYVESRDYLVRNLCSDFGGILGLWLGISVVTAFEVIELFVHIFMACPRSLK